MMSSSALQMVHFATCLMIWRTGAILKSITLTYQSAPIVRRAIIAHTLTLLKA